MFIETNNLTKTFDNMARPMVEYYKTVLQKVSFDVKLFKKELKKAIARLLPDEIEELKNWLKGFISDKPELKSILVYLNI